MQGRKKEFNFVVETVEAGQRRKYGDRYYHYKIENKSEVDFSDGTVERFCRDFLQPAARSVSEKTNPFETYMTMFRRIGDRLFEYKCVSPSTH